jgi:cytochrome d ubiquinol oxidase subunit I
LRKARAGDAAAQISGARRWLSKGANMHFEWDALLLSRLQFAFTIGFHIIFPSFTIGLASFLAVLEGLWLFTKKPHFKNLYLFWVKIFALSFGMGVVSGVVMSYQFGTNWSAFSAITGSVIGPLLAYEVLTAFFLEASFLGIILFGWTKVGPKLHFFSTCTVAVGTLISAFWILAANSWMQTPQGFAFAADGTMIATSFIGVIFNPSLPSRLVHMVLAAYLTTAMVVAGASAFALLRGAAKPESRTSLRMAVLMMAIVAPLQIMAGHESGIVAGEHQPAKVAAIEGWWTTRAAQPTILFGWPNQTAERTDAEIGIDGLGSWVNGVDANTPYLFAVGLFAIGYFGLAISLWPYIVPFAMTPAQAAAADNALQLMLWGALPMLPIILGYTAYVYWIFRAKVSSDAAYH